VISSLALRRPVSFDARNVLCMSCGDRALRNLGEFETATLIGPLQSDRNALSHADAHRGQRTFCARQA
jgi:hypothetical protein